MNQFYLEIFAVTTSGGALCRDLDDVPAKAEVALLAFRDYEVFCIHGFRAY